MELCEQQEGIEQFREMMVEHVRKSYAPYIDNIKSIIDTSGQFNTDMFDAFFYHVLGVFPGFEEKKYAKKDIKQLLTKLQEVEFLKNIDLKRLLSLKETYQPVNQLEKFYEKYGKKPLSLVIGEGHAGLPGFESISRYSYGKVLAIDIQPFWLADITSDINNLELLNGCKKYYSEHFYSIVDTTNMNFYVNFYEIFQGNTFDDLFSLLRPGGQFKQQSFTNIYMELDLAEHLIKKYGFKPVYCEKNTECIIALEKPK